MEDLTLKALGATISGLDDALTFVTGTAVANATINSAMMISLVIISHSHYSRSLYRHSPYQTHVFLDRPMLL